MKKTKILLSLLLGSTLSLSAHGFKDGVEYYRADQPEEAAIILNNTLNQASTDQATAYYYLGQIALNDGNVAVAKADFDKGIAADPKNGYNYVGLGALALKQGNASEAKDYFSTAKKMAKKNADVLTEIGRAYYKADPVAYAKEIDKAIADAKKADKTSPAPFILEGDRLAKTNVGDAAGMYEMAAEFDTELTHPEAYVKYARTYFQVNPEFAINKLNELLALQPNSALAQRELAEKYYDNNQLTMAAEQYGKYIQNPNHFPEDKARYAVLLYWGENFEPSLKVADEILADNPSNFLMQRMRFLNETALGRYQDAVRDAQSFFTNNPNGYFTTNDYVKYAEALNGIGEDSLAVVQYELAVKNDPENKNLLKDLSDMYTKNKDFRKAAEAYDAYLQTQENPSVQDLYGITARYLNIAATATDDAERQKAGQRGLEYIDQVLQRAQPQAALYQRKARLYVAKNGNRPDADAIATYGKMLELLDADSANKQAGNPALNMYKEAYSFEMVYYSAVEPDKDKHAEATADLDAVNALLGAQ